MEREGMGGERRVRARREREERREKRGHKRGRGRIWSERAASTPQS